MDTPEPKRPGHLPPGEADRLRKLLEAYRRLGAWGAVKGVQIEGPHDCPMARQVAGAVYPTAGVPDLPLAGCRRAPFCTCTYVAVT